MFVFCGLFSHKVVALRIRFDRVFFAEDNTCSGRLYFGLHGSSEPLPVPSLRFCFAGVASEPSRGISLEQLFRENLQFFNCTPLVPKRPHYKCSQ